MVRIGPKGPVSKPSASPPSGKTAAKRIKNTSSLEVPTSVHSEEALEGELIVEPVTKVYRYLQEQSQNLMHDRRRTQDRRKQSTEKPYLDVRTGKGRRKSDRNPKLDIEI